MNSKKIMLVEDNPSDVKLTKRALEQNQSRVARGNLTLTLSENWT